MKRPDFSVPTYDAAAFRWDRRVGVADASDLGLRAGVQPGVRVWGDACDVGFYLRSPRTRAECLFVLCEQAQGSWTFASVDGTLLVQIVDD